jgi:hypothetical protein
LEKLVDSIASESSTRADSINGEWNAPPTLRGNALFAPASFISSIEVLHEPLSFVLGPKGKGGAILITTKGIDEMYIPVETENISFITPLGYQITREFYSPAYDSPAKVESGIPDERVTVYWNSNVELDNQGKGYFEFYTSDSDKGQTIVVEGMTEDGISFHLLSP